MSTLSPYASSIKPPPCSATHRIERSGLHVVSVHVGAEVEPPFVGAERARVLDAHAAVEPHGAAVVEPRHPKRDLALRLDQLLGDPRVPVILLFVVLQGKLSE